MKYASPGIDWHNDDHNRDTTVLGNCFRYASSLVARLPCSTYGIESCFAGRWYNFSRYYYTLARGMCSIHASRYSLHGSDLFASPSGLFRPRPGHKDARQALYHSRSGLQHSRLGLYHSQRLVFFSRPGPYFSPISHNVSRGPQRFQTRKVNAVLQNVHTFL